MISFRSKTLKLKTIRGFGTVKLLQVKYQNRYDKTPTEGYMVDINTAFQSTESRIYPLTKKGLKAAIARFMREVKKDLLPKGGR